MSSALNALNRVFIKNCVFSKKKSIFCDLSLASTGLLIGWNENGQPIGVTMCTKISDHMSPSSRGWVAVNREKTHFLMNTL